MNRSCTVCAVVLYKLTVLERMGGSTAKLLALHEAVVEDDPSAVRKHLADNGTLLNSRGAKGLTALHLAIAHGALNTLHVLLEDERTDVTMVTPSRETLLILAAAEKQEEIALQLLHSLPEDKLCLSAVDGKGRQALHHACQHGLTRLVDALIQRGASAEARAGKLRLTPLMIAAQSGREEVVQLLLDSGGQTNSTDLVQMTALHHACLAGTTCCAERLLQDPATIVDCQDISSCTPLLYCFKNKNKELEQLLIKHGASLTKALDTSFSELCYHTVQGIGTPLSIT